MTKRKPGRPTLDAADRASVVLRINVTQAEADAIKSKADAADKRVSAFCRDAVLLSKATS